MHSGSAGLSQGAVATSWSWPDPDAPHASVQALARGQEERERSSESPWKRHLRTSPWEAAGSRTAAEFMCQASTLNSLKKNKFWDWNCKALMLNCGTPSEHQALCAYASPGDYLMSTKYYNVREPLLPFSRRGNGDLMLVAPSPMKAEVVFDPRHNWNEPE